MEPVGPEQIQDTHEHDCIALCVCNLGKYKRMKKGAIIVFGIIVALIIYNGQFFSAFTNVQPGEHIENGQRDTLNKLPIHRIDPPSRSNKRIVIIV